MTKNNQALDDDTQHFLDREFLIIPDLDKMIIYDKYQPYGNYPVILQKLKRIYVK